MAISKLADSQEITRYAHAVLPMLGDPGNAWTLAILKQVEMNNDPLTGRNRTAYWSYTQYPQSSSGPFSEGTPTLASGNAEEAVELQMVPVDLQRTIGLSWQKREQLARMSSDQKELSIAKLMTGAMNAEKAKLVNMFEGGRGDNVGARAFTSTSGTTFTCDPAVPILFQRGDILTAYKNPTGETNEERLRTQADTGTAFIGSTNVRVVNITRDADTPSITLNVSATWTDDAVLCWASNPTLAGPFGIPNHVDSVNDANFKWDVSDGTSTDHTDIYHGGTRSSNSDLNCWTYNASTAELDIPLFSTGLAKCMDGNEGDPTVVDNLVVFMHPRQYRRFVKNTMGAIRLQNETLFLPGSTSKKYTVPMLTGQGVKSMPLRTTYNVPDGFVVFLDMRKLRKVMTEPRFIPGSDGIWHLLPQASVAGYQAQYEAYLAYTFQSGLFLPRSSGVIYGLDTSVSV